MIKFRKRVLSSLTNLLTTLGILMTAAYLTPPVSAQSGKLEQIAPGVWFREGVPISRNPSRPEEMGNPNAIIIEMKDYLIVVDANYPSGAHLIMDAVKTVSAKPVKYVLITHHHGDHSYGSAEWRKAGATTVAYVGLAEEMKRYEPAGWQGTARRRPDVAAMNPPVAEPPMQTFDKSPFVLDDGKRRVEMHFFGWAHTRGDGFIFLPKEKILCTGDALANGGFNYVGNGSIRNWNNVLAKAKALGAKHVLPGHGRPGGLELFEGQMLFITELQKAVQKEIDRGKKLEELVFTDPNADPKFPLGNLKTTIQLPSTVEHWISVDRLPRQVSDTYAQLTDKK